MALGELRGKGVLVTGGTRGVGRAIAAAFARAGATVVVCSRSEPDEPTPDVTFVACDVRDPDQVRALVERTVETCGGLDVVVNNAGGSPPADTASASPRFSEAIIGLNLLAPLVVAQRANAVMQGQDGGGCVLNIGSVSGLRPSPGTAAYGAAKAGLINLTATLAVEWAPKVRVNCISPGPVLTEHAELHFGDADATARVGTTIPMGRMANPADVAAVCVFLASPEAAYVTGANVVLDGGGERPAFLRAVEDS